MHARIRTNVHKTQKWSLVGAYIRANVHAYIRRNVQAYRRRQGQNRRRESQLSCRLSSAQAEASGSQGSGHNCSKRVFKEFTSTSEAFLGLCASGTQVATDVGSYSERLANKQRTFTSGFGPNGTSRVGLLPIPLALANPFLDSLGAKVTKEVEYKVVKRSLGVLAALILCQYTNKYVYTYIHT